MKFKKEYLIIFLVILGLSVYIYTRTTDRVNYDLPEPASIKSNQVTRIIINKQKHTLTLNKQGAQWVAGQRDYPVRTESINNLLQALDTLQVTDLVSKAKDYQRYSLDSESAIEVKAWIKDELIRSFRVGKAASTYQNAYIKLDQDPNVYLSKSNLKATFNKNLEDVQDKTVLNVARKKLQKLVLHGPQSSVTLVRGENGATSKTDSGAASAWTTDSGRAVASSDVEKLVQSISGLQCSSYLEDKEKQDLPAPDYRIVLHGGEDDALCLYLEKEDRDRKKQDESDSEETRYLGTSRENGFPFALSKNKGKQIVEALDTLLGT